MPPHREPRSMKDRKNGKKKPRSQGQAKGSPKPKVTSVGGHQGGGASQIGLDYKEAERMRIRQAVEAKKVEIKRERAMRLAAEHAEKEREIAAELLKKEQMKKHLHSLALRDVWLLYVNRSMDARVVAEVLEWKIS